jgi:hypothetical protein
MHSDIQSQTTRFKRNKVNHIFGWTISQKCWYTRAQMPSGCPECRELAESCVSTCRELEWVISRQKLEAMRHNFRMLNAFEADIDRLNRRRGEIMAQIYRHVACHSASGGDGQ